MTYGVDLSDYLFPEASQGRQPKYPAPISNNPICAGLGALYDTVNAVEIISGKPASNRSTLIAAGVAGNCADFSGTANQQYPHTPGAAVLGPLTIFALAEIRSLTNCTPIITKQDTTSTNTPYELRIGNDLTDSKVTLGRANTNVKQWCAPSNIVTVTPGRARAIAVISPSGVINASGDYSFVDGVKYSLSGGSGGGSGNVTDVGASVWIGRRLDGYCQLDGRIYYVAVWNRVLLDSEILSLSANPWQLFDAPIYIPFSVAASGTSVTLTGQYITGGQGSTAPDIEYSLSGQALTGGQGAATSAVTITLTGQVAQFYQGTVTPVVGGGTVVTLNGQSLTAAQGSISPAIVASIVGQIMALGQGTVSISGAYLTWADVPTIINMVFADPRMPGNYIG